MRIDETPVGAEYPIDDYLNKAYFGENGALLVSARHRVQKGEQESVSLRRYFSDAVCSGEWVRISRHIFPLGATVCAAEGHVGLYDTVIIPEDSYVVAISPETRISPEFRIENGGVFFIKTKEYRASFIVPRK